MIRRFSQIIFVVLILLSLLLSLSPASTSVPMLWNDKLIHFTSYFVLIMMFDFSWNSSKYLVMKSALVLIYSALIEYGQSFIPGRDMSLGDLAANALGICLFILLVPLIKHQGIYRYLKLT